MREIAKRCEERICQNKTKVGLKCIYSVIFVRRLHSQNKTKVGLKEASPLAQIQPK